METKDVASQKKCSGLRKNTLNVGRTSKATIKDGREILQGRWGHERNEGEQMRRETNSDKS